MTIRNLSTAVLTCAVLASCCLAGESAEPSVTPAFPRAELVAPAEGAYLASFPDLGGSEDDVTLQKIADYEKLTGRRTAWVFFSNNWYDGIKFPRKDVDTIHASGSVPYIRLMPRTRRRRDDGSEVYSMQRIIDGEFDEALRQWARDARDVAKPLLAEFGTEVNGSWFPWNGKWNGAGETDGYGDKETPDGPERFRDAFRRIISICREEGANNIVWFFHVDAARLPADAWNNMAAYYPGDEYIDWLGISVFGSQRRGREWLVFTEKLDKAYAEFAAVSATKPLAVVEYGVVEDPESGSKPAWLRDAIGSVMKGRYPRIKAMSYWHESWGSGDRRVDIRLDSSPEALAAYRELVADDFFIDRLEFSITTGTETPRVKDE